MPDRRLSDRPIARLCREPWPGNVRELEHTIERLVALSSEPVIDGGSGYAEDAPPRHITLKDRLAAVERGFIIEELARCKGNYSDAARRLGISRPTLYDKLERYGLEERE